MEFFIGYQDIGLGFGNENLGQAWGLRWIGVGIGLKLGLGDFSIHIEHFI